MKRRARERPQRQPRARKFGPPARCRRREDDGGKPSDDAARADERQQRVRHLREAHQGRDQKQPRYHRRHQDGQHGAARGLSHGVGSKLLAHAVVGTPVTRWICSAVAKDGVCRRLIRRLTYACETPKLAASSFCVNPVSWRYSTRVMWPNMTHRHICCKPNYAKADIGGCCGAE